MDKRAFLQTMACAAALPDVAQAASTRCEAVGGTLLTLSGAVANANRGEIDLALDQLLTKHGVRFKKARTFDYAELAGLPPVEIRPTLEYDARPHTLRGPALTRLLELAGAASDDNARLVLRAFDGYTVELTLAEIRHRRVIVATHIDDTPLPLGGLGPLWAVHDADRIPELSAQPLSARFAQCPWGLYSVHVQESDQ